MTLPGDAPLSGDYSADALQALADALERTARERRQLEALGAEATPAQVQALLSAARSAFAQLSRDYGGQAQAAPVQTLADLAASYWDEVNKRRQGAPTGFAELDKKIGGGLQPERLYVLLGGTGSGKTTLANQMAEHIAGAGRPVFYVTSEDAPSALLAKTVARLGQVDYSPVLYGYASAKSEIEAALALVVSRPSAATLAYLHDTGTLSLEQMQDQARAHFGKYAEAGPGLLVIDYLQRMARMQPGQKAQDTRDLVTLYTMRLRAVAEELHCSVLALSSIGRASYNGKTDWLGAAKESGDVEYTGDCILALAEDEKGQAAPDHKAMKLHLAKNRLGPASESIDLDWYGRRQQFSKGGWV
jgi:replicative DNA helicase